MNLRYVALGMIDGTLITLGVVTATREVTTLALALTPALAAGLSSALSNAFGAYVAETAVAGQELAEFEKHLMVPSLSSTSIESAYSYHTYLYAATMALFAVLGASIPLLPLILLGPILFARIIAISLALVTLFCIGAYIGTKTHRAPLVMGLRTSIVGGLVTLLAWSISAIVTA